MGEEFRQNGTTQDVETKSVVSDKNRLAAGLLCFFLGMLGIHRFYVGKAGTGAVMLLLSIFGWITAALIVGIFLLIPVGIWVVVDLLMIIFGNFKDKEGRVLK